MEEVRHLILPFRDEKLQSLFSIAKNLGDRSKQNYLILDSQNEVIHVNESFLNLTGFSKDRIMNIHYLKLIEKTKEKTDLLEMDRRLRKGKILRLNLVHKRRVGSSFYAEIECIPLADEKDETKFVLVLVRDVTYTQLFDFMARIEQEMYNAIQKGCTFTEKLKMICDGIDTMFYQKSLTSIVIQEEDHFAIIHSNSYGAIKLENMNEINFYRNIINGREILVYDYLGSLPLYRPQKEQAYDMKLTCIALIPILRPDGTSIGLISIIFDEQYVNEKEYFQFFEKLVRLISLAYAYELKQREIYELAYFDKYITIPNRHGFINNILERDAHEDEALIQIIEPDNFPRIVELYGRDAGDELLKQIYERLLGYCYKPGMLVGRLSSSALILHMYGRDFQQDEIENVGKLLVMNPFMIAQKQIYVTLKVGVSFYKSEQLLEDTIRQAERALTIAKRYAGTFTSFYKKRNDKELEREVEVLNHMIEAIKNKSFSAHFQPKIELHRGRVASMEALSRWHSPELGNVSPMEFIAVAERAGIVNEIDLQIIEQVLHWFQRRQYEGKRIVPVAVNISPEHFYHPNFVENLLQLVQRYYADPNYLIIEITESIGLVDAERASEILRQLNLRGFRTSIDDFGIGYSALSYLQKLRFNELKIDRSFTIRIHEVGTRAIVKSIIDIAKALEVSVVAEGVETQQQRDILKDLGCYCVQGYYYYKPMSMDELERIGILD